MRDAFTRTPVGARFYHGSRRAGGGNLMFLFHDADPPLLMKLYRPRGSRLREALGDAPRAFLSGKTGISAVTRCRTERRILELWQRAGVRAPRVFERPAPEDVADVVNWIEYWPGRNLALLLEDDLTEPALRLDLIRRLAADLGRRHRIATETGERGLVHESASVEHVLVQGDELVTIDHETSYRSRFDLRAALTREIAGQLRSIAQVVPGPIEEALAAFVAGYPDPTGLRRLAENAVAGDRSRRRFRRNPVARAAGSDGDEVFYALLDALADDPPRG